MREMPVLNAGYGHGDQMPDGGMCYVQGQVCIKYYS